MNQTGNIVRVLLTGLPRSGKTTAVQRVAAGWGGRAAGFYTREMRHPGSRVGFEIVTLAGQTAVLSHVDFPGPWRVGKYGVNLEHLHQVALPALVPAPGVDLIVVDEIGKMECLSTQFIAALENLWRSPVHLLATVAAKGGGYIQAVKQKPEIILLTIKPQNREQIPAKILNLLKSSQSRAG
ncbi:MAG: nucleoside-triphosphatase [Desulfobacteraceae bacterium]